jgi:hypothetical protein
MTYNEATAFLESNPGQSIKPIVNENTFDLDTRHENDANEYANIITSRRSVYARHIA